MTSLTTEQLQQQLKDKDAEISLLKQSLQKASNNNSNNGDAHENGIPSATSPPASHQQLDDKESLRKQLNEANSRWRWEERRAKAREEELQEAANIERARADALKKDMEEMKQELNQSREKIREATRKRAQIQAEQTALKGEMEAARSKLQSFEEENANLRKELEGTKVEVSQLVQAKDDAEKKNADLVEEVSSLKSLNDKLSNATAERDDAIVRVATMEAQLAASEARANTLKQTMRHNAQLVKDLKAELAKAMSHGGPAGPFSAPSSPPPRSVTPPAVNQQTTAKSKEDSDLLVKELASRLESLLTQNGTLTERIRFLEDIVQSLTAELNTFKQQPKRNGPVPARPNTLRGRDTQ